MRVAGEGSSGDGRAQALGASRHRVLINRAGVPSAPLAGDLGGSGRDAAVASSFAPNAGAGNRLGLVEAGFTCLAHQMRLSGSA